MEDYSGWEVVPDYNGWEVEGEKPQQNIGWGAIGEDIWSGLKKAPGKLGDIAMGTAKGLINPHGRSISDYFNTEGLEQGENTDPFQNYKIAGAGLATGTRDLANVPGNIVDYAHEREIAPSWLDAWRLPEQAQNYDFNEAFGANPETPGQQLLYGAANFLPSILATGGMGGGYPAAFLSALSRNENPVEDLGAMFLGHKATQGIAKTPELINKIGQKSPAFMSQEKIGKQIGGDAKALAAELGGVYEKVKTTSKEAGIKADTKKTVTEPTAILDEYGNPITREVSKSPSMQEVSAQLPGAPKSTVRNVHAALESGDIGQLIDAESMLGKDKSKMWLDDARRLKALDRDSYDAMTEMEGVINNHIEKALNEHEPTLAEELFAARNKYHVELGPYKDVPAIREYMYGNLAPKDLVRLLQSNTKSGTQFRAKLADKYKAVGRNKFKNDLVKMGLKTGRVAEILLLVGAH